MLSEIKTQARRDLHSAMAVPASYSYNGDTFPTPEQTDAGLTLTARYHTKQKIVGERTSDDVAILEGINRLVFNSEELVALNLTLARNGVVILTDYNQSFRLDTLEETDGPINVYWGVIPL